MKSRSVSNAKNNSISVRIPFQIFLKMAPIFERFLFLPFFKRTTSKLEMEQRFLEIESRKKRIRFSRNLFFIIIEDIYLGDVARVLLYDVTQCPNALFLFHPLYSVSEDNNRVVTIRDVNSIREEAYRSCQISITVLSDWGNKPQGDKCGQTIPGQRPFGCETEFTSRARHHVTIISKNGSAKLVIICWSYK